MKCIRRCAQLWVAMCLVACVFAASAETPRRVGMVTLDIKSQSLADALTEFSRQSGVQVLFYSDVGANASAPSLSGRFTPDTALTRLLSNSGLTYSYVNSRTVEIHRAVSSFSEVKTTSKGKETNRYMMRLADLRLAEGPATEDVQQTTGTAANARESDNNKRQRGVLEEVIVTARKRAEKLQDVPISIAVVSADDIDRSGLVSAEDYLRGIPGVNQVDIGYGQSIVIRGLETSTNSQNFFSGTTVATYFGETPTTNTAGLGGGTNVDLKLVDIERVEVLRGPQGTAFGNSSMGGAVRTIPVAPKLDDFEGKVAGGYSVTSGTGGDNYNIQAVGNLPLIKNKLALRATGYWNEDSGFYRNVAGSDAAFQAAAVTPYGAEAFAIDEEEVGAYYFIGGRIAALFQASDDLRFTLSYLSQKTETDGFALAGSGTYEQTLLQVAPEHVVRGQKGGVFDTDIDIVNAIMEYNIGWADLLATYSDIKSGSVVSLPFRIFNLNWPVSQKGNSDHREHVGEIRLATQLDGAWNFLAGLYVEELKDETLRDESLSNFLWHGDPATNFLAPGERSLGGRSERRNLKQKAAFGEASWEFLRGLTLTGGVRAYDYDRTTGTDADGVFFGADGIHVRRDVKASGTSFRANLSYKPDEDALIYAGWSQGFRLGQAQPGLPPGVCDRDGDGIVDGTNLTIESTRRVNSDEVDSYELGGKFALLDRRLTIAADVFRMEWSGMPVTVTAGGALSAGCGLLGYTANAGEALSEGVEFEANFHITEPFRVDLGGSWIHARLTEDVPALNASKGNRLPGSPEVNANLGLQYGFKIGGYKAFVRADSIYVGPFFGNLQESPDTKSGDYVKLDASARMEIGNFNIDLFVRNLTNEDAFTFRGAFAGGGEFYGYRLRPRTIGLRLGYTF